MTARFHSTSWLLALLFSINSVSCVESESACEVVDVGQVVVPTSHRLPKDIYTPAFEPNLQFLEIHQASIEELVWTVFAVQKLEEIVGCRLISQIKLATNPLDETLRLRVKDTISMWFVDDIDKGYSGFASWDDIGTGSVFVENFRPEFTTKVIIMHEIGHVLGAKHINERTIMNPDTYGVHDYVMTQDNIDRLRERCL